MPTPRPTALTLHRASHALEVNFEDGENFMLPCEYLRTHSPSAEVQGHGPLERTFVPGKRHVKIRALEPVGHYATRIVFDDGHDSGLFTWSYLLELGREHEEKWQAYLKGLAGKGLKRD